MEISTKSDRFVPRDYSRQRSVLFSPHAPLRAHGGYRVVRPSSDPVLWEVDVQVDFMHPGGRLYVPGAEKLIPNIDRLVDVARRNGALLISSGDRHPPDDPEFEFFPPHCVRGTRGAEVVPEGLAHKICTLPNGPEVQLAKNLLDHQQIFIEKQTLDVFDNPHTERILEYLPRDAEFLVFGVVTEYCVRCAASGLLTRGRRVSVIRDAIEHLNPAAGLKTIGELTAAGAEMISTAEALTRLSAKKNRNAETTALLVDPDK